MPGALLDPRGRAECDGHGPCSPGVCGLGGATGDTIPKGTNESKGDASCEGRGGKGAHRGGDQGLDAKQEPALRQRQRKSTVQAARVKALRHE